MDRNKDQDQDIKEKYERQTDFSKRLEERQLKMEQYFGKSHIMRKQMQKISEDSDDEQSIVQRLRKIKETQHEQNLLKEGSIFNSNYWKIYFKQNHQLFAWMLLNFTTNFVLYPLDTIKTRIQANNRFMDISHFQKNNVEKVSLYPGLAHRLSIVLMTDFMRNLCMRVRDAVYYENKSIQNMNQLSKQFLYAFASESLITALFFPIELRKISLQMAQREFKTIEIFSNYSKLLLPAMLRDSFFYFSTSLAFNVLKYQDLYLSALMSSKDFIPPVVIKTKSERNENFACMMGSIIFSLIITNPLDVVITKMATQQDKVYKNPIQAFKFIQKQESFSRLLLGGISTRFAYYLLKGTIFFSWSESVSDLARQAFE